MIKYILFDLDGVLFGNVSDGADCHSMLFIGAVNTIIPNILLTKEYHDNNLNGMTTINKLKILAVSAEESNIITYLKKELLAALINNIVPNNTQKEMCKILFSLKYQLYCVSNSDRSIVEKCLNSLEIMDYFSDIIGKEDCTEHKPSPKPYLTAYSRWNINPNECLIIEDSIYGIESARLSGGNVLRVSNVYDVSFEKILKCINNINTIQ